MKIGLLGLAFESTNKGCEALGYGFLNILEVIAKKNSLKLEIEIFEECNIKKIYKNGNYNNLLLYTTKLPEVRKVVSWKNTRLKFQGCDFIFDFTAGDSFSDIYGMRRFIKRTVIKMIAIKSGTPFILGSQTYGPYSSLIAKVLARYVMKHSRAIFSRDYISCKQVNKISYRDAIQTVDVAFAMQYTPSKYQSNKISIGFNPSGLLWNGGYEQNNQFGLRVDYREYCIQTLRKLLDSKEYEIILVPHVISNDMCEIDNDMVACHELRKIFPALIMAPFFESPVEAKSYISGLDIFIGARMHATIAAFTTGVPVLPFSYSPKFEGMFGSMDYPHLISGREENTETAIIRTVEFCKNKRSFSMERFLSEVKQGVDLLVNETERVISVKD